MSQSVNPGEKPADSEAAVDAVEPVETAAPAESVEPVDKAVEAEEAVEALAAEQPEEKTPSAEEAGEVADQGGDADDTPTLNLDEESQDAQDEAADSAELIEPAESAEAVEPAESAAPVATAESVEQAEEVPAVERPEDGTAEGDSAEGGDADGTPTLNLDGESQDEPVETAESVEPAEETSAEAQEGEPAGTFEAVKPAQVAEAAQPAAPAESAVPVEPAESAEPAAVEAAAAEPVATPASMRVVDEAATPAEALSPYESAGADASAETRRGTAWSPDSGDMPPSITPKSLSGASPSTPEQSTPAVDAARAAEPAEGDADPVGDNAAPAAVPGTLAAAATTHQPAKAQNVAKKTNSAAVGSGSSRRRRLIPAACAAGAAALLLAWGGIAWWTTQHIASGTTVSGVDVSGLSPKEAHERIGKGIGDQLAQPVTLTVGQGSSELVPAKSGISVDTDASVKKLTGFTLNPLTLAQRLGGQHTDAVIRVDSTALRGALEDRVDTMANGAVSATVTLDGTKPVITPASNGIGLDVDASLKQLGGTWPLGKKTLAMAEGTATPAITDEEASTFVNGTLTPLLSSGLTVNTAGADLQSKSPGAAAAFSPQDTAEMLKISSEGGTLSATFDPTALRDGVVARVGQVETPAQNATWKIDGSATGAPGARPQYVPAAQGKVIDTAALSTSLLKAGTTATDAAGRTVTLPMVVAEPTVTTPQNEWGISEAIGEFATPYNAGDAPRTQNLTRGAELVNGTVVKPGEVFSLEKVLGEVDGEHGFAAAGVIQNGEHVDAMGGGLSQVATTTFNAGFEAGMDDTEHHPHQYYFERYPAGREATLWTGNLDMKFTNSTPHAVLVQAWLDGEQIHVRMWSTKYYDVSITSSERSNFRPVRTEHGSGPNCEPTSGGQPGFDITVTRARKHDGKALPDDVLTTKYDGDVDVICN